MCKSNDFIVVHVHVTSYIKYKGGNDRPSSVNQKSLVHNRDKAGIKCNTQDNTNTRETQWCE